MIEYEQPAVVPMTLLERMTAAGISEDRARKLITDGLVRVDGSEEPATDPGAACPKPTAWTIRAS